MAVRTRDFPDGTKEIRIRITAHGFVYSQLNSEEVRGCLTSGDVRIESKVKPLANPKR